MKLSTVLPVLTTAAVLAFAGPSQAVDTTFKNKNGSLRVTMQPSDSVVVLSSYNDNSCATGMATGVFTDELGDGLFPLLEGHCDVKNIRAAGLNGNNLLTVAGLNIPQGLDVRGGLDDDTVLFIGPSSMGQLFINLRGGNNTVDAGIDPVVICLPSWLGGGCTTIFPGSGAVDVAFHVDIDTRGGDDEISFFELNAGGMATMDTGGGADEVGIDAGVMNKLIVNTGNGDDDVELGNLSIHLLQVFTGKGKGNDDVDVTDLMASNTIDFVLGADNDTFTADNVSSTYTANANGGSGTDSCTVGAGWMGTDSMFEPAC